MSTLPGYYSRLEPFRELLRSGTGILTYHHVGSRPAGVRLKGLYVSPKLFTGQMRELRDQGFVAPAYDEVRLNPKGENRVYITFDDGFRDVLENCLPVLEECGFKAIQFLVPGYLGQTSEWQTPSGEKPGRLMNQAEVKDWVAAGHRIGSHTVSHPFLTRIPAAQAREEIFSSKKKLEDLFGQPVEHFCYPYGDWDSSVRDLVQMAGYQTACTTSLGINKPETDPFALSRITARYPSRNWRGVKAWTAEKVRAVLRPSVARKGR